MSSAADLRNIPETMTREQFLHHCAKYPGHRYERSEGFVFAMSPERSGHVIVKGMVCRVLQDAVKLAGKPCRVYADGMTVRVGDDCDYEPDAVVRCGPELPRDAVFIPDPMVVVEVLSPGTRNVDLVRKLVNYFRIPTVMHYLIFDADKPWVMQYNRVGDEGFDLAGIVTSGPIGLKHPGIIIKVEDIYDL